MEKLTKIRAVGGSLIVTIPIEIVKREGLKEDEVVEIEIKKYKKDFFGALKNFKLSPFTEEDRLKGRD